MANKEEQSRKDYQRLVKLTTEETVLMTTRGQTTRPEGGEGR